jgi:V/A-type H+-transporting ATPase subunit I
VAADLSRVLRLGAIWAIIWGVVFGEVLGDLGSRVFGLQPIWINREEAIEPLLLFALGIGAAHIVLGLLLGLWAAVRADDRRQLGERAALLAALCALFTIAGGAAKLLPSGVMTPAASVVAVALVVLVALQWPLGIVMGPLDLIGIISNVLSYLRIAAIGLASVFLARVANELGAAAPLALGLVIAALFHALNLALGTFSPMIQALRLHYVEFFDKFYESGGVAFVPFGGGGLATTEATGPVALSDV